MNTARTLFRAARHALRSTLWRIRNVRRGRAEPPDYVIFALEGSYPELSLPRTRWWEGLIARDERSLRQLEEAFDRIARAPRVRGVVLVLRDLAMSPAELQRLRALIEALQQGGKRVVAWAQHLNTATYFIASAADEILLIPGGTVYPLGLSRPYVFLRDAMDEAGVEVDAVQITPYKAAPDTFTRSEFSPEARENAEWLADDAYESLLAGIAAGRGLDTDAARRLVDRSPYTDREALDAGVIDGVAHEEALPGRLAEGEERARLEYWKRASETLPLLPPDPPGPYVALVRVEGIIVTGRSRRLPVPIPIPILGGQQAGDLTIVQQCRAVLADEDARALLLFIDSRGGSAEASEAMAAALEAVAAVKPVVAVMGSVAASGGYYVATPANWIVAQPGTITGSIGVVAAKGVIGRALEKQGFNRELIRRGESVALYDPERAWSDEERAVMRRGIERTYEIFIDRVAKSREMSAERVAELGGGRVWSGRQAFEHGLVDELGGIPEGLDRARRMAGLDDDAPLRDVVLRGAPRAPGNV